MNEHSPTPWCVCPIIGIMSIVHYCLCDAEDKVVGRTMDESVANRIVEAVNERDRLREERDAALAHADECERDAADERAKRARAVEEAQREVNLRADRIEAALKRERGNGNAARMREALEEIERITSLNPGHLKPIGQIEMIARICDAALSAPPRNCDIYTYPADAEAVRLAVGLKEKGAEHDKNN